MTINVNRRELMKLAAVGGVVFASRLTLRPALAASDDFYFVQLSDLHWGFQDPKVNPDPRATLERTIAAVNAVATAPDFIVFTGDLTHRTDDGLVRRQRMEEVKGMLGKLKVTRHVYLPGEHDAAPDRGTAFKENFGETHQAFDHKGLHFVALDNTSDPAGILGEAQIAWLAQDLKGRDPAQPIAVLTHRPLFDLKPVWDWHTKDAAKAIELLAPFQKVTVFYGHVHHRNQHVDGNITHLSARSAMYPLPPVGTAPQKAPLPWDAASADHGIGWREIEREGRAIEVNDHPTA